MKSIFIWNLWRALPWLTGILLFSQPAMLHASPDPCSLITPREISEVFGQPFDPPHRTDTPAGSLEGPSVTCTYKSKTLELTVSSFEYLTADQSSHYWETQRSRAFDKDKLGPRTAIDVQGVGESAYYFHGSLQSHAGVHEYNFTVGPSSLAYSRDWRRELIPVAKLFYSRLK